MFTVRLTQEFQDWLDGLKDIKAQLRIVARLRLAESGNLGDWKPVGNEVSDAHRIGSRLSRVLHETSEHPHRHARWR